MRFILNAINTRDHHRAKSGVGSEGFKMSTSYRSQLLFLDLQSWKVFWAKWISLSFIADNLFGTTCKILFPPVVVDAKWWSVETLTPADNNRIENTELHWTQSQHSIQTSRNPCPESLLPNPSLCPRGSHSMPSSRVDWWVMTVCQVSRCARWGLERWPPAGAD